MENKDYSQEIADLEEFIILQRKKCKILPELSDEAFDELLRPLLNMYQDNLFLRLLLSDFQSLLIFNSAFESDFEDNSSYTDFGDYDGCEDNLY